MISFYILGKRSHIKHKRLAVRCYHFTYVRIFDYKLSVRLRTKWLWLRIPFQSLKGLSDARMVPLTKREHGSAVKCL